MPYEIKGKCIYKKDGGAKVGCTKGDVHKYMAALHANTNESTNKGQENIETDYYRGVGMDEALKACQAGHLIYLSKDPMSRDWEVIEYSMGDTASEASDQDIEDFVESIVPWKNNGKGVNLTTDLENAKGYSPIVLGVDVIGETAEFSESHVFAQYPKDCIVKTVFYKGKQMTPQQFLHKFRKYITEANQIKGGKADKMTVKDIADKFHVPVSKIEAELRKGKKVEHEHTNNTAKATEIAMDHLSEFPDYYTRLEKMEKEAEKHAKKLEMNENTKSLIKRLIRENLGF